MLKSFSEGISTGQENFAAPSFAQTTAITDPKIAETILKTVKEGVKPYFYYRDKKILISKHVFRKAQATITARVKELQSGLKEAWKTEVGKTMGPPRAVEKEIKGLKALLRARYPAGKMSAQAAKPIAQAAAKEVIKRKGLKMTAKLLKSFTKSILPWVGWGIVISDLVRRAMKMKMEKKAEGFGEYYHKDIGWY